MNIHDETLKMKLASPLLSASSLETRNKALALIRESLNAHKEEIFEANRKDLALAEETGVPAPVKKRLKFDEAKLSDVTEELTGLMALPDPLRNITLARELDQGLTPASLSALAKPGRRSLATSLWIRTVSTALQAAGYCVLASTMRGIAVSLSYSLST